MIAAALGVDHPALSDSDDVLLATYLEGYDAETVAHLHEQGWVKVRPAEDARAKVMLRSEAMGRMGLDPLAGRARWSGFVRRRSPGDGPRRAAARPDTQVPPLPQLDGGQPPPPAQDGR